MERAEVIKELFENQDLAYREFHLKTCPGAGEVIGVRMPVQRKIAKKILSQDYRKFLSGVQNQYYEETLIEGLVIAQIKVELTEKIFLLRNFVPKIHNWAICDAVCASLKFRPNELEQVWDFIMEYHGSSHEFERRFMIVMMMQHFLELEYLPTVLQILDQLRTDQYYVNMAAAWLIAEALTKFREPTMQFLEHNSLSNFVQNKAIQKARDSYRVAQEDKELLTALRRKS